MHPINRGGKTHAVSKIGIRPAIDGRWGGIRESLEDQIAPRLTGEGAFRDVYSVMANWGANRGVTVYGHVGAELITLASMLRIPVTMHNVAPEKVYRPHAWAAFGTQDTQAADYAACKHYGPLYGKL